MSYQTDLQKLYAFSLTDLDRIMSHSSQQKARQYLRQGRVHHSQANGALLSAQVRGSDFQPYQVEIQVENGQFRASCTCPYDQGGWCKHIGAVLLEWIDNRGAFEIVGGKPELLPAQSGDVQTTEASPTRAGPGDTEQKDSTPATAAESTAEEAQEQLFDTDLLIEEYASLLAKYKNPQLQEIARERGIALEKMSKDRLIQELASKLADVPAARALMLQLDDVSKRVLAFLDLATPPGYGTQPIHIRPLGEPEGYKGNIQPRLTRMTQLGLILNFTQRHKTYYVVPQTVRLGLPLIPGAVEPWPLPGIATLNIHVQDFVALNRKIYHVWNYIAEHRPRRSAMPSHDPIETQWEHLKGWPHLPEELEDVKRRGQFFYLNYQTLGVPTPSYYLRDADRRVLCAQLSASDEEVEFYCALLAQLETITGQPDQPIQADQTQIQRLLNASPAIQLATMMATWQVMAQWSEMDSVLRSVPDLRVRRSVIYTTYKLTNLYEEWREGRATLMRFLNLLEENRWVSVEAMQRLVHEIMPNLTHYLSHTGVWWFESARQKKQFGFGFDDWQTSYGQLVAAAITGPLMWLGAVQAGYRNGELKAFRLTPTGSFLLGRRHVWLEQPLNVPPEKAITLTDDMVAMVMPGAAPLQLYDLLGAIGRLENVTAQHLAYRVTADGVQRRFEQGETAEALIARLEELCPVKIPATWTDKLLAWQANYGNIHLYQDITVIELADDYALQELLLNTSLRESMIYQFSPRLVAVRLDAVNELVSEMEKRGYTPRID